MFKKTSGIAALFCLSLVLLSGVLFAAGAQDLSGDVDDYSLTFECEKEDLDSGSDVNEDDIWGGEEVASVDESVDHSADKDDLDLDSDSEQLVANAMVMRAFRGYFFKVHGHCGARVSFLNPATLAPTYKEVPPRGPYGGPIPYTGPDAVCEYTFYVLTWPQFPFQVVYFNWPGGIEENLKVNIF